MQPQSTSSSTDYAFADSHWHAELRDPTSPHVHTVHVVDNRRFFFSFVHPFRNMLSRQNWESTSPEARPEPPTPESTCPPDFLHTFQWLSSHSPRKRRERRDDDPATSHPMDRQKGERFDRRRKALFAALFFPAPKCPERAGFRKQLSRRGAFRRKRGRYFFHCFFRVLDFRIWRFGGFSGGGAFLGILNGNGPIFHFFVFNVSVTFRNDYHMKTLLY